MNKDGAFNARWEAEHLARQARLMLALALGFVGIEAAEQLDSLDNADRKGWLDGVRVLSSN